MLVEWFVVGATFLSPFFAVQASQALAMRKEQRDRKFAVFHALMLTRGHGALGREHVQALNSIDIAFHNDKKAKQILSAWRSYRAHLNSRTNGEAEGLVWVSTRADRLTKLLEALAKYFKYEFDEAFIRDPNYAPQFYEDLEADATEARKLALEVLRGQRPIPFRPIVATPVDTPSAQIDGSKGPQQQTTTELKRELDGAKTQ